MSIETTPTSTVRSFNDDGYAEFFRRDAHQLLAYGYQDARPKITTTMQEPQITLEIARAINRKLESFNIPEEIYNRGYTVKAEDPIEKSEAEIKEETRLDILIEETRGRPRARYIFEAKRLKKSSFPIGKYCDDGVVRFVERKYASQYPEAAMVGCLQSDNANYWLGELTRKFEQDKEAGKYCLQTGLKTYNVISELPNEWVSVHYRSTTETIRLFHIFLDCQ